MHKRPSPLTAQISEGSACAEVAGLNHRCSASERSEIQQRAAELLRGFEGSGFFSDRPLQAVLCQRICSGGIIMSLFVYGL